MASAAAIRSARSSSLIAATASASRLCPGSVGQRRGEGLGQTRGPTAAHRAGRSGRSAARRSGGWRAGRAPVDFPPLRRGVRGPRERRVAPPRPQHRVGRGADPGPSGSTVPATSNPRRRGHGTPAGRRSAGLETSGDEQHRLARGRIKPRQVVDQDQQGRFGGDARQQLTGRAVDEQAADLRGRRVGERGCERVSVRVREPGTNPSKPSSRSRRPANARSDSASTPVTRTTRTPVASRSTCASSAVFPIRVRHRSAASHHVRPAAAPAVPR